MSVSTELFAKDIFDIFCVLLDQWNVCLIGDWDFRVDLNVTRSVFIRVYLLKYIRLANRSNVFFVRFKTKEKTRRIVGSKCCVQYYE